MTPPGWVVRLVARAFVTLRVFLYSFLGILGAFGVDELLHSPERYLLAAGIPAALRTLEFLSADDRRM